MTGGPSQGGSADGFVPTHRVPAGGLISSEGARAEGGLDVQVLRTEGGWAEARFANGWTGWFDPQALEPLLAEAAPPPSTPPPTGGGGLVTRTRAIVAVAVLAAGVAAAVLVSGDDDGSGAAPSDAKVEYIATTERLCRDVEDRAPTVAPGEDFAGRVARYGSAADLAAEFATNARLLTPPPGDAAEVRPIVDGFQRTADAYRALAARLEEVRAAVQANEGGAELADRADPALREAIEAAGQARLDAIEYGIVSCPPDVFRLDLVDAPE